MNISEESNNYKSTEFYFINFQFRPAISGKDLYIMNLPDVADKFKDNILLKVGTEHPMVLYKRFRGHEPKADALLKRAGLI